MSYTPSHDLYSRHANNDTTANGNTINGTSDLGLQYGSAAGPSASALSLPAWRRNLERAELNAHAHPSVSLPPFPGPTSSIPSTSASSSSTSSTVALAKTNSAHPYPSIPPKSALRVRTESGRLRSNSHAVGGAGGGHGSRFDAQPLSAVSIASSGGSGSGGHDSGSGSGLSSGRGTSFNRPANGLVHGDIGATHHFTRSYSAVSPLERSSEHGSDRPRDARDVFAAVRGLRGQPTASPASPDPSMTMGESEVMLSFAPEGYEDLEKEVVSFAADFAAMAGHGGEAAPMDDDDGEEGEVLDKIRNALRKSGDIGDTLDLSRKGIYEIGSRAVDMFRRGVGKENKGVWRLALSYNHLSDNSIDSSFSSLSRLRYLNLKGNNLTQFPSALSEMPALEILDLSKNHLTGFPLIPGRLTHLKVLSLTNNKIYTLPDYLVDFGALKVFKVDNNPIEWPPREVLGALIDVDQPSRDGSAASKEKKREEDLRPWIQNMKSWMRQRATDAEAMLSRGENDAGTLDDFADDGSVPPDPRSPSTPGTSQYTVRPIRDDSSLPDGSPSAELRPPLGMRSRSGTIASETQITANSPARPPPLNLVASHTRKLSSAALPSSATSPAPPSHSRKGSASVFQSPPIPSASSSHSRGASYTASQRMSGPLSAKKSLPDLRQSHAKIMQDRRDSGLQINTRGLDADVGQAPISALPSLGERSSPWSAEPAPPMSAVPLGSAVSGRTLNRVGSADVLARARGSMASVSGRSPAADRTEGPPADDSRNSYFRRLSTLPVSSISKTIPPTLLGFVDGIRGILFALSQMHTALRQYLLFAVADRVAGLFSRVLDPASGQMNSLVNALDRFDSASRRGAPSPAAVKGVIEAARNSIAVFLKVVAMLQLQMPALRQADARYTRTFLLMMYGAMAEVSYAWSTIAPRVLEMRAMVSGDGSGLRTAGMGGLRMIPTGSFPGRTPVSPIPERGESHSPPSVPRTDRTEKPFGNSPLQLSITGAAVDDYATESTVGTPTPTSNGNGLAARGAARRQGGSFSTQDVQKGMMMHRGSPASKDTHLPRIRHQPQTSGSSFALTETSEVDAHLDGDDLYDLPPNPPFANSHRASRSHGSGSGSASSLNAFTLPQTPPEVSSALQPIAMVPTSSQGSQLARGHRQMSSAGSSQLMLSAHSHSRSHGNGRDYARKRSVDWSDGFDDDLLDVIENATDVAFTAWLRLAEEIGAVPGGKPGKYDEEMSALLSHAEQVTTSLREILMRIRADPSVLSTAGAVSFKASLKERSESFVKAVVKVTEFVVRISPSHSFSASVKSSCAKLVQLTREFAILFSVSTSRPATSASHHHASFGHGRGYSAAVSGGDAARAASPVHPYHSFGKAGNGNGESGTGVSRHAIAGGGSRSRVAGMASEEDLLRVEAYGAGDAPRSAGLRGLRLPSRPAARERAR